MQTLKRIIAGILIFIAILGIGSFIFAAQYAKTRPVQYASLIHKYADERGLDPNLVVAIIKVESDFDPNAVSPMDARGLMQILPETAQWIAEELEEDYVEDDLFDPEMNISYGTYYLKYLIDHFKNQDIAIAAYNGGMGNVGTWLDDETITHEGEGLEDIPIDETREYVVKVNTNMEMYQRLYDGKLPETDTESPSLDAIARHYKYLFEWFFIVH